MAIDRIWQAGFEVQNVVSEMSGVLKSWGTVDISSTQKKTGSYALRISNAKGSAYVDFTTRTQLRLGFYARLAAPRYTTQPVQVFSIANGITDLVEVRYDSSDNDFNLFTNGSFRTNWAGGWIVDQWYHFGVDYKRNASTGWISIYVDGILRMTYSGDLGATDPNRVFLGSYPGTESIDCYSDGNSYYDDFYLDDSVGEGAAVRLADLRFHHLYPNANGNYSNHDGSDGNKVDNYLLVDERPPDDDTEYVYATAASIKDSYGMLDFSMPGGATIQAVIIQAVARKDTTEDIKLALGSRLSSTDLIGTAQILPTTYGEMIFERQSTKPGGGVWADSDVDSV